MLAAWRPLGRSLIGIALLASAPAQAELYRCVGADGKVSFTDNPGACGDARVHEPADVIQNVPAVPPPAAPRRPAASRRLQQQAEADAERSWRMKKRQSERELEVLERRREQVRDYVAWCNRGGDLYRKDEAGLKRRVSCDRVDRELEDLEARVASLRAYLDEGLQEECRRAGCLPGWVR